MKAAEMFPTSGKKDNRSITLIAYDISDNKRSRKLEKCLRGYGLRVQKSVFEALISKTQKSEMIKQIKSIIDQDKDTVRIYIFIREDGILSIGAFSGTQVRDVLVV